MSFNDFSKAKPTDKKTDPAKEKPLAQQPASTKPAPSKSGS